MKFLLVSSAFFPEISPRAFRAAELARELVVQGHEVTVLTLPYGEETHSFARRYGFQLKFVKGKKVIAESARRESKIRSFLNRVTRRLLMMLLEYPDSKLFFLFRRALWMENGYDILISFAAPYPVHWSVAWVRRSRSIAKLWVADCGDPFTGNQSDRYRRLFYFAFLEKWSFRLADFITIPIESARNAYFREFHHKIRVIPQGVRFDDFTVQDGSYSVGTIPRFAYAGSFIPGKRDPSLLLDYLLQIESDYRFEVYTSTPQLIKEYADKSGGRILVRNLIPRQELISVLSKMDFLLHIENSTNTQMPSKLIDYYLAKRPVLSVKSDQVDRGCVEEFLRGDYSNRLELIGYEKYRIESIVGQFIDLSSEREEHLG